MKKITATTLFALFTFSGGLHAAPFDPMAADRYALHTVSAPATAAAGAEVKAGGTFSAHAAHRYGTDREEGAPQEAAATIAAGGAFAPFDAHRYTH